MVVPEGENGSADNLYLDFEWVRRQLRKGAVETGAKILAAVAIPLMVLSENWALNNLDVPQETFEGVIMLNGTVYRPLFQSHKMLNDVHRLDR